MAPPAARQARTADRRLAAVAAVSGAAGLFAVLLVLVRLQWSPLESLDHDLAARLNALVAPQPAVLTVLRAITWLGSPGVLWTIIGAVVVLLAIRRRYRLAVFLVVAGAGALVLDPVLKGLVGRLRPVVAHPVAHGTGNSFPSGHALGSIVCYGALLLVFLPVVQRRWRTASIGAVTGLVVLIGTSRIMLGVHYLSDVVGAWALGVAWLGVTAFAVEIARREAGEPVSQPLAEGLEPQAAAQLRPTAPGRGPQPMSVWRTASLLTVCFILTLGAVAGLGELVTHATPNLLGDTALPRWLAAHRRPGLTDMTDVINGLGATGAILIVTVMTCAVAVAITRRLRAAVFVAVLMVGEPLLFLVSVAIVDRPRPAVSHLDAHLPTASYPSGHVAATICLYTAIAILVIGRYRSRWRLVALVPAIGLPVAVAGARMYRGMHHPTDVLGSVVLAAAWIIAGYLIIQPTVGLRSVTRVVAPDDGLPTTVPPLLCRHHLRTTAPAADSGEHRDQSDRDQP